MDSIKNSRERLKQEREQFQVRRILEAVQGAVISSAQANRLLNDLIFEGKPVALPEWKQ